MSTHASDCFDCAHSTSGDCGRHRLPVMGVMVPASGTAPLPAATVTVVPTCPAHPGEPATGACGSCLREARERAEKAETERDEALAKGYLDEGRNWKRVLDDLRAERDAARREAAAARACADEAHERALAYAAESDRPAACEAVLREALRQIEDGAPELTPEEYGCAEYGDLERDILEFGRIARQALATPADRAALDALLAAERERCARIAECETELTEPVPAEVTETIKQIARAAARAWVSGSRIARRIRNPEGAP